MRKDTVNARGRKDRQADMTKLTVDFRSFVKGTKNHLPLTEIEVLFLDCPARIYSLQILTICQQSLISEIGVTLRFPHFLLTKYKEKRPTSSETQRMHGLYTSIFF